VVKFKENNHKTLQHCIPSIFHNAVHLATKEGYLHNNLASYFSPLLPTMNLYGAAHSSQEMCDVKSESCEDAQVGTPLYGVSAL
jgi:hypothetical protein